MNPLMVGGAMIGPQSSSVQTQLGSVINGIVNYEYWRGQSLHRDFRRSAAA
jgi:hypothetical protein